MTDRAMRKAAATGNPAAMSHLGALFARQGKDAEAEEWLRKAPATADTAEMFNLGVLLAGLGRAVEAEEWYRKPAKADAATG